MPMPAAIASAGPLMRRGLAVDEDLALVGLQQPVEHVHQRRLAGAVLAEQRVDLTGLDDEVDVVVGHEAAEALRDAGQLQAHERPLRGRGGRPVTGAPAAKLGRWDDRFSRPRERWGSSP